MSDIVGDKAGSLQGLIGTIPPEEARTLIMGLPDAMVAANIKSAVADRYCEMLATDAGEAGILDGDDIDHQIWLPNRRADIGWRFWPRYQSHLLRASGIPETIVKRLNETTDQVLERLEDPKREGQWDRRGLIVGDVQSGKTSHYIGLAAKAIDAGYGLVIILAGLHNNLRWQTQERVDQGITGSDSARLNSINHKSRMIGVGKVHGNHPAILSVTGMHDFSKQHASGHNLTTIGSDVPVILVVKKNKSILENLIDWLNGRKILTPALVIDDEGDNASIDTSRKPSERELFGLSADERRAAIEDAEQTEPTVINGLIRRLLISFDRRAFVAYTATPFANVFIDPDARSDEFGPDLFPSAFIINLGSSTFRVGG